MQTETIRNIAYEIIKARMVYCIGNGGSASQADHLACDLLKNAYIPAISLCNNSAILSAISNDYGYENVFKRQLEVLFNQEKDLLIILSTRGNSANLIEAANYVYDNPKKIHKIIGIVGFDGGKLKKLCSITYLINSDNMQEVEDEMAKVSHEIYRQVIELMRHLTI